jgi:hypothetical protein
MRYWIERQRPRGLNELKGGPEHLRRAHPGCESNAVSGGDQIGVPIGDSRRAANDFARAISAP